MKIGFYVEDDTSTTDDPLVKGEAWLSTGGNATYPNVKRPIGFMRRKPTIRVKAWTMPILKD